MWSGSEELWTRSAIELSSTNQVFYATKFYHNNFDKIRGTRFDLSQTYSPLSFAKKAIEKISSWRFSRKNHLKEFIKSINPALVIISQGNNLDSLEVMEYCLELGIKYITLTQLVTEFHFLYLNSSNLKALQKAYLSAAKNYFVSQNNADLNSRMLGIPLPNAALTYNPCKVSAVCLPYPENVFLSVALVGRIECYHKGYDLLLEVLKKEIWRGRNVQFNFYGEGPHKELLEETISSYTIKNIHFRGQASDVTEIWKSNHILCMPSRMEGQALSLIEAMNCGRMAIVTNVGGAAELIEDGKNGFIAESANVRALENALERAWENRERWDDMGKNAYETIRSKYPDNAVKYFNDQLLSLL